MREWYHLHRDKGRMREEGTGDEMTEDEGEPVRYVWIEPGKPVEWSADFTCLACNWPWHLRGESETPTVDIHQTIKCPNCGQAFTMDLHHE